MLARATPFSSGWTPKSHFLKHPFVLRASEEGKVNSILSFLAHTHCLIPENLWVNVQHLMGEQWLSLWQFVMK